MGVNCEKSLFVRCAIANYTSYDKALRCPIKGWMVCRISCTWIGRGGPVVWPTCSPDINYSDFFMWGQCKCLVCTVEVESVSVGCNASRTRDTAVLQQMLASVMGCAEN
jgi:hypothetical protein